MTSAPSAPRSWETYFCTIFAAVAGGRSPQSSSIRRWLETTSFGLRRSTPRSARGFAACSGMWRPPSAASSGPRIRNSTPPFSASLSGLQRDVVGVQSPALPAVNRRRNVGPPPYGAFPVSSARPRTRWTVMERRRGRAKRELLELLQTEYRQQSEEVGGGRMRRSLFTLVPRPWARATRRALVLLASLSLPLAFGASPASANSIWFTPSCSGLSCSFSASGLINADNVVESLDWTFGDGGTGSGGTVEHTYAEPGTYTVDLTATVFNVSWEYYFFLTASQNVTVTLEPAPPPPPPPPPPDSTPPETTITSGPAGTTTATSATFEFAASELSTFMCSLDGQSF